MPRDIGHDPELRAPHGDPEAVRAVAQRLHRVAGRALATAGVRGDAASDLTLVWSGAAADQAGRELAVLSARARHLLPQLGEAGDALVAYADVLEETIRRTTSLRARAEAARDEHARLLATARATSTDPVSMAATGARADLRLADALAEVHRAHGRVLDDFMAGAARCARTLSGLAEEARVGSARQRANGVDGLLDGLALVQEQVRIASVPPVGPPEPPEPPEESWGQWTLDALGGAAAWTYNHTAVPAVNAAADVAQAAAEHPEHLVEMALGAGMIVIGSGGQVGGVALDATGVGAVAGVPLHVVAAGLMATGTAATAHGASGLLEQASRYDNRVLREVDGPYAERGSPGDPLPDSLRPDGAGATWKGRVSDNGKGEVWQDPDKIGSDAHHKDADSMRYMDPTDRHPNGYVRYHAPTGQPLTLDGKPGTDPVTHHPIKQDFTYDIPRGWNP